MILAAIKNIGISNKIPMKTIFWGRCLICIFENTNTEERYVTQNRIPNKGINEEVLAKKDPKIKIANELKNNMMNKKRGLIFT